MPAGYVNLPAAQFPKNAMFDFSPIQQGIESGRNWAVQEQNAMLRMKQDARADSDQAMQKTNFGNQQEDRRIAALGRLAQLADEEKDPVRRQQYWDRAAKIHPGWANLGPEYQSPITGPRLARAEAGMLPKPGEQLDMDYKRAQISNVNSEVAERTRKAEQDKAFLDQFTVPPAATMPAPNKLGGPVPEGEGAARFSSIGQGTMPPPMMAGAPTGQTYNVAEGEAGPGLQIGDPMPQGRPVAQPQAAQKPTTLKDLFDRLPPDRKPIALGLLQAGKREEFINMLQGGEASGKPATEQQSKDAFFVRRMLDEERTLDQVVPTDVKGNFTNYDPTGYKDDTWRGKAWFPDGDVQLAGGWLGSLPTRSMNSSEWNRYYDTANAWIAALLRKDTGAAVTKDEWNKYYPTNFPQPGDSPAQVLDKKRRRLELQKSLAESAGPLSDRMNSNYKPDEGYPGAPKIHSEEEYHALASGTSYTDPKGVVRTKK